jgi:hypothetical protein
VASTLEKQACIALKQIQEINEGAFLPIVQEPAVQALILPFGGWGGIMLFEYFVLNGFYSFPVYVKECKLVFILPVYTRSDK